MDLAAVGRLGRLMGVADRRLGYSIKAQANGPALVSIYDEVGFGGVTSRDFVADLAEVDGDIELHLNSGGGDVFEGLAIYQALSQRDGIVGVVVDALAASVASVIAMAASPGELSIAKNASVMIHDAWSMGAGNSAEMGKLVSRLEDASENIASIYAERTGRGAEQWRADMRAESWYRGQAAVDAGLADKVLPGKSRTVAARVRPVDLEVFEHAPAGVLDADSGTWDGAKAMANGAAAQDPAKFYAGICAGRKAGDPAKQASWALPYRYRPGDAPDPDGVRNALARLPQTDGLTNRAEAQALLNRLMKQINPDHQAPASSALDIPLLARADGFHDALKGVLAS
jgi:ATP-dependent protease ClpP protease subunit